jgi:hypothetical protein
MTAEAEKKPNPFEDLNAIRAAAEAEMVVEAKAEILNPGTTKTARRRKPGYITLPADWIEALKRATPHPPWGVALYLVQKFIRSRENGKRVQTIAVSSNALEGWRIGPYAKVRDLRSIEAAGLIKIEPLKSGQLPRVTWLVDPEG